MPSEMPMRETSEVRKIAFVGDHLPRKCGIATFTSDLLAAVADAHPQSQCFAVPVNDIKGGYEYPEVVRFEIEEQDLSYYVRAAELFIGSARTESRVWARPVLPILEALLLQHSRPAV